MYFSHIIPLSTTWLLCGAVACVVAVFLYYRLRILNVTKYRQRAHNERPDKADNAYLPASIVVYSQGDADNVQQLLTSLLHQDYPAAYEVIVVNDGEATDVRDVVSMLRNNHPNLYLTFTPEGVVNLSRKKLALTLGIKAARHDVVVLTTSAAIVPSDKWLRRMMSQFDTDSSVEIVLGVATVDPDDDNESGRRRRAFLHTAESMRWLGVAIAGHPFRGTEYNIAYRRSTFMNNKGFARSLNLHHGDDDIFISEIANGTNTRVEMSDDSMVVLRQGNTPRLFNERVLRRIFTERFIRRRPHILPWLASLVQLVAIVLSVIAAVSSWPNASVAAAAIVIVATMIWMDIYVWRLAMQSIGLKPLLTTIPWFVLTYPIQRALAHAYARMGKQKRYTWD